MSEKNNGEKVIQDEVREELEQIGSEDLLVEYGNSGGDDNQKTRFVEKWFPSGKEWQGKTNIEPHQARALSLVRHLDDYFEEIDELGDFLREVVTDYEMYRTSVNGESREQHVAIMRAMFGADTAEEQTNRAMRSFLANGSEDKDD